MRNLDQELDVKGRAELREDLLREEQDGAGEDDGHDARVVDLEREEGALTTHDFIAHHALGVLDRDLALALHDHDNTHRHGDEEDSHNDGLRQTEALTRADRTEEQIVGGDGRIWNIGQDTDGDEQRDAITDAALGDLLAEPHQEHGASGHENYRGDQKS